MFYRLEFIELIITQKYIFQIFAFKHDFFKSHWDHWYARLCRVPHSGEEAKTTLH